MGTNHHTAWAAGTTSFTAAAMNPALASLDRAITYHKGALIGCDGTLSWAAGTLTWSGTLHIYFTSAPGTRPQLGGRWEHCPGRFGIRLCDFIGNKQCRHNRLQGNHRWIGFGLHGL